MDAKSTRARRRSTRCACEHQIETSTLKRHLGCPIKSWYHSVLMASSDLKRSTRVSPVMSTLACRHRSIQIQYRESGWKAGRIESVGTLREERNHPDSRHTKIVSLFLGPSIKNIQYSRNTYSSWFHSTLINFLPQTASTTWFPCLATCTSSAPTSPTPSRTTPAASATPSTTGRRSARPSTSSSTVRSQFLLPRSTQCFQYGTLSSHHDHNACNRLPQTPASPRNRRS